MQHFLGETLESQILLLSRAYFKVTSQQMVGGKYMYETWADKESGKQAFTTSTKNSNMGLRNVQLPGLPPMIRCDAKVF